MDRAAQFREAAVRANRHRERMGWRYPEALRRLAVDHCEQRRRDQCSYSEIAEELYAIKREVPGPFPGDEEAQEIRLRLRGEKSRPILQSI